ncbi:hypothetical protein Rhe02_10970 [Rhizocola hellebori]|uniref:Uncharacterized protein n=1 Tax=Rhizocola hellebori TaxID=1392758 RepID=A0A8J3Q384_9ACTN|nr:hypothetical protein [Rhizocola hellebori]GIH03030.1 hypothetical protein Rhe02_10970 [Rhizocola hellebori]
MSVQLHDDDVVARLRAGAPGLPAAGPDARLTLAAARRALRRSRGRRALGGVAAVLAAVLGLAAIGPVELPGIGTFTMPFGYDENALPNQGNPPLYPRERMLRDVASLESRALPATQELGVLLYIEEPAAWGRPACRVFTWSQGAYRDRDRECVNPDDPEPPFDPASEAAFARMIDAIDQSHVDIFRIEKGGWGPGTSFHLRDDSWRWNWYYSYVPGTPPDAPAQRTETKLGPRLQVHVTGDWWFTVEPDD